MLLFQQSDLLSVAQPCLEEVVTFLQNKVSFPSMNEGDDNVAIAQHVTA